MLKFTIPGRGELNAENVVFDYNGTIAVDGIMSRDIKEMINELAGHAKVYILTADTYGTVKSQCEDLNVTLKTFPRDNAAVSKRDIVKALEGGSICVGNGYNDVEMFKICDLSIAIIGQEGCCGKLLSFADIVVNCPEDAFMLLLNPDRVKATLRS
ncbi:ATPase P [Caloramator sp. E03]|uniref:HAD family hydrolase n=1 Tax=Caloramator sp. E03 TaxID=2576307 RepID=UPI001110F2D6|nr:HAD family hydrolase [Caloramator sp. E03]QCX33115.1 ATPase P [Caloramator sp. E03]